jgi:hypothetical protein
MNFSTLFDMNSIPRLDAKARANRLPKETVIRSLPSVQKEIAKPRQAALLGLSLLWHDHWDAAHQTVQAHEGNSDCDLIHGILHRREGDLANARFWCRQVPDHPGFAPIAAALQNQGARLPSLSQFLPKGKWSALAFLQAAIQNPNDQELQTIQALELTAIAQLWWSNPS